MIARLTAAYLFIFACVLAALSIGAFAFEGTQYRSLLLPALRTPEGQAAYAHAMRAVALTIGSFDVPLLIAVGLAAWGLARVSLGPLLAARERERAFVADIAHELRSPLATIASVAQAHRNVTDEHALREAFSLISATALDAGALIGDMLTLARAPNAHVLSLEPLDLALIVDVCVREIRPRLDAAGIAIELHLESAIVNGDSRRLRELVRNLLDNAFRHARTRVSIACGVEESGALIRIADDGLGVPTADRERIFERFFHGSAESQGSGLGLAIAQWVARAHDGLLILDDVPSGASFTARIPLMR